MKKLTKKNNFKILRPETAKEWHPTKNGELKPENFSYGSNKKVWWKCQKGHEWQAVVTNRSSGGAGCPYCANRLACPDNDLKHNFPDVAAQWNT